MRGLDPRISRKLKRDRPRLRQKPVRGRLVKPGDDDS
jgi:hypothetical protein